MIGTRIRYYRKRSGLTLEQLSEGICSVSYLSKIEHGDKTSEDTIKLLCERLGISYKDVDNQEELDEINELLDEWYSIIRDRNIVDANEKEKIIINRLNNIQDPILLLKFDLYKSRLLMILGNTSEASSLLKGVEKFSDILTTELQYFFFHFTGINFYNIEDFEKSIDYIKKAEYLLIHKLNLSEQEFADLYYHLSLSYIGSYSITKSINYAHKALTIFEKDYNLKRIADCQTLLGICNRRIYNYEQAKYHYNQALKFAELYDDNERRGIIHHNIGFVYSCQGNPEKAIEYLEKGQQFKSKADLDPKNRCITFHLLAKEYCAVKETKKAQKLIDQGIKLAKSFDLIDCYYDFKILDVRMNQKEDYESILKEAIPYFKKIQRWDYVAEYAEELANFYYDIRQYKSASQFYRLANDARKQIN
ncbi:helix-turn-helix domain-containing protein [Scopulibacillus cellulosilyticus]|uniref:Helix-turn-helix domain-containing protein n=1 Tax=Scopulibacillus cellulosilyticus TaxID=2665665 RepID=A0ABW2PZY1_9BACL